MSCSRGVPIFIQCLSISFVILSDANDMLDVDRGKLCLPNRKRGVKKI